MPSRPPVHGAHVHAGASNGCNGGRPATSSASTRVLPLSSRTRWNAAGPSPGRTPSTAMCRGSSARRSTSAAGAGGTPRGRGTPDHLLDPHHGDQHLRQRRAHAPVALRLDDEIVPVSATAKFAPEIATRARRTPPAGGAAPLGQLCWSSVRSAGLAGRGTDRGSRRGSCGSRERGGATAARRRAGRSAPPDRSRSAGSPQPRAPR